MNFSLKRFNVCLPIYNDLLQQDYYSYRILRRLADYYKDINIDSCKTYLNLLEKQFSSKCVIEGITLKNDSLLILNCNNCLKSNSRRDSIKARVELTKYYLKEKNYGQIEQLYNGFSNANKEFILDSLKIWEAGEYYDIMSQSLFLKQEYAKLCSFLVKDVSYNLKINVKNDEDLYNLVKSYYLKYNKTKSLQDFDAFFNKNFFQIRNGKKLSTFV